MAIPSKRQLAKEKAMVQRAHALAIEKYGVDPCNQDLSFTYIVPPDAIFSTCEICGVSIPFIFLAKHIRTHRGFYLCQHRDCYGQGNRFKTPEGLIRHRCLAHHMERRAAELLNYSLDYGL